MSTNMNTSCVKGVASSGHIDQAFKCKDCSTFILLSTDILSKSFTGMHGKALTTDNSLVTKVENITKGPEEVREMRTGQHTVTDVFCAECMTGLGWFYVSAKEEDQKYKEGRYCVEKECLSDS